MPALAKESDERLQAALAASARAEASLSGLFRAIQQLDNGLGGAREANESLTLELEGLRDLLGVASEKQHIFERKIRELEHVIDRTRQEHAQERGYLIDQQDLFLVKLLDEQELELKERDLALEALRGRLAQLEHLNQVALAPTLIQDSEPKPPSAPRLLADPAQPPAPNTPQLEQAERAELERTAQKLAEDRERARETVSRLQAQRDEAQIAVARMGKELDEALNEIHRLRSELGGPRIPLSTRPPSSELRRDSSPGVASSSHDSQPRQPISSVLSPPPGNAFAAPLPSRLSPPPSRLSPPPSARHSDPPEELRRALTGGSPSQPAVESRSSALKQKPDASTRPLVGYSLGSGSVAPESLESATHLSPSSPSSGKR